MIQTEKCIQNKYQYSIKHTYTSNSSRTPVLEIVLYKTLMIL